VWSVTMCFCPLHLIQVQCFFFSEIFNIHFSHTLFLTYAAKFSDSWRLYPVKRNSLTPQVNYLTKILFLILKLKITSKLTGKTCICKTSILYSQKYENNMKIRNWLIYSWNLEGGKCTYFIRTSLFGFVSEFSCTLLPLEEKHMRHWIHCYESSIIMYIFRKVFDVSTIIYNSKFSPCTQDNDIARKSTRVTHVTFYTYTFNTMENPFSISYHTSARKIICQDTRCIQDQIVKSKLKENGYF
jgi:hypothetical protein